MDYAFLVETYASERLKTLNVWAMFQDDDLDVRPHLRLARDRTPREHMVHQCTSEDKWFTTMFGLDVGAPPLPPQETRLAFIRRYAEDSGKRLGRLREQDSAWWERDVAFFDTIHSRAWIMVRRIAHTAHHRAEQTTLLRLLGREVHSVYGPSVDTGGAADEQRGHDLRVPGHSLAHRRRVPRWREGGAAGTRSAPEHRASRSVS